MIQYSRPGRPMRQSHSRRRAQEPVLQPLTETRGTCNHHGPVSRRRVQNFQKTDSQQQVNSGTVSQFVSFYFTNVLEDISYNCLRQGFEVCGIMEDVYLARKRNVNGGVFGFVRYGKVRDVDKLLKALNNVWFGDCKVVAKVASFDRFENQKGDARVSVEGGKNQEGEKRKVGGF